MMWSTNVYNITVNNYIVGVRHVPSILQYNGPIGPNRPVAWAMGFIVVYVEHAVLVYFKLT